MPRLPLIACLAALISAGAAPAGARGLIVYARLADGPWRISREIYTRPGRPVQLRVRPVPGATVRWFQIVPQVDRRYHNAGWPWDPNAYRWLGWARIEYRASEIMAFRNKWVVTVFDGRRAVTQWPYAPGPRYWHRDQGSFWFQAEISRQGRVLARSAGLDDRDQRGLLPRVLRVTVRRGAGLIGFVSGFFNVPAVFGATPYQSRNYIGLDCAEVIMAAYRQRQGRRLRRDFNVQMVTRLFPMVGRFDLEAGRPNRDVRWGRDVRPGDLIAVRYRGARFFQHIGLLAADRNGNGRLDPADLVLHLGPDPLAFSPLADGFFDGSVLILRPR
jgi:hypothetical protein